MNTAGSLVSKQDWLANTEGLSGSKLHTSQEVDLKLAAFCTALQPQH